jgi:hypothetical protein
MPGLKTKQLQAMDVVILQRTLSEHYNCSHFGTISNHTRPNSAKELAMGLSWRQIIAWRKSRDKERAANVRLLTENHENREHHKKNASSIAVRKRIRAMLEVLPLDKQDIRQLVVPASRHQSELCPDWPLEEDSEQKHWLRVQKSN